MRFGNLHERDLQALRQADRLVGRDERMDVGGDDGAQDKLYRGRDQPPGLELGVPPDVDVDEGLEEVGLVADDDHVGLAAELTARLGGGLGVLGAGVPDVVVVALYKKPDAGKLRVSVLGLSENVLLGQHPVEEATRGVLLGPQNDDTTVLCSHA